MSNFEKAYEFTKKWEGGYVFDPVDPGGETNRGITDRRDGVVDGKADIDADGDGDVPIKELTEEDAKTIYKRDYYDVCGCGSYSVDYAVAIFDTAVNCGVSRTLYWLKGSVSVEDFLMFRETHYELLCEKRPALKKYLKGWMNRLNALRKYIEQYREPIVEASPQSH